MIIAMLYDYGLYNFNTFARLWPQASSPKSTTRLSNPKSVGCAAMLYDACSSCSRYSISCVSLMWTIGLRKCTRDSRVIGLLGRSNCENLTLIRPQWRCASAMSLGMSPKSRGVDWGLYGMPL